MECGQVRQVPVVSEVLKSQAMQQTCQMNGGLCEPAGPSPALVVRLDVRRQCAGVHHQRLLAACQTLKQLCTACRCCTQPAVLTFAGCPKTMTLEGIWVFSEWVLTSLSKALLHPALLCEWANVLSTWCLNGPSMDKTVKSVQYLPVVS